jgi:hypothetical protein
MLVVLILHQRGQLGIGGDRRRGRLGGDEGGRRLGGCGRGGGDGGRGRRGRAGTTAEAAAEVSTEAQFAALVQQARQIAEPHAGAFCQSFELDLTGVPLLEPTCDDIAQSISVTLPVEAWRIVARRTPSRADDAYVEVMGQARGAVGGELRIYGGDCVVLPAAASAFAAMVSAPAPQDPEGLLATELGMLRDELFSNLTGGGTCSGDDAALKARLEGLMKLGGLTAEERQDIEAALHDFATVDPEDVGGD